MEQVDRAFGVLAQSHRVGELGRRPRVASCHQLDARARVRVDVCLTAEVLDEVDDDLHALGVGEFELLGPNSEGDLRQTCGAQLAHVVALELQRRITDLDAVGGDGQVHQVHRR
jgi:hypothetical protein